MHDLMQPYMLLQGRTTREAVTGHLSARHLAYYAAWERMIDLEAKAGGGLVAREAATGLCMGNMLYVGAEQSSAVDISGSGASHVHTLCKLQQRCSQL
jgi:hypothetical protein